MRKVHPVSNMIYLDHASSSKVENKFVEATQNMLPRFYANPQAQHILGYEVNLAMEASRKKVAKLLHRQSNEIYFTSSGSEANNLAIKGIALANQHQGKHIISAKTEHLSVLNSLEYLKEFHGFTIDYLQVDQLGNINLSELENLISENTIMVTLMAVNNEIATIHPISEIQKLIKKVSRKTIFVVDGVAAIGKIDTVFQDVDVLTISQHKLGGISGSGCLIKKGHISMVPIIHGGQQEFSMRAGTPFAIANIIFGDVLEHALNQQKLHHTRMNDLKDYTIKKLQEEFGVSILSHPQASPYIVSFFQKNVHSSIILNGLSNEQVYVSSHSACASESKEASHVLLACGYNNQDALGMIRVSFHYDTSLEDIDGFLEAYKKVKMYVK